MSEPQIYDYIIVGAGSAGCVLANRLSVDPKARVLLLEAGPDGAHIFSTIPRGWPMLTAHKDRAWAFPVEAEHGRSPHEVWQRGRGLGGSSAINGMLYCRGAAQDYDSWGEFGVTGWSSADMARAFTQLEAGAGGGPLETTQRPMAEPLRSAILAAGKGMGLEARTEVDGGSVAAVGTYRHTVNRSGVRASAARIFLEPVRSRRNLEVRSRTRAKRLIVTEGRVQGVLADGPQGEVRLMAHEVILSCGALQSPHLLQVSGIGPGAVLQAAGITPVRVLSGVGRNLGEHMIVGLPHRTRGLASHNARLRGLGLVAEVARYGWNRSGLMSYGGGEMGAFFKSGPEAGYPDVQLSLSPYTFARGILKGKLELERAPGLTAIGYMLRPQSRGQITAQSPLITDMPKITPNWLSEPADVEVVLRMVRQMRAFLDQPSLAPFLEAELWPGRAVQTDADLLAAIKAGFVCGLHAVGTCRMGSDSAAVVDDKLRVHGVRGLRVVDASVIPAPISGNTNGPVMALAWRAADLIRAEAKSCAMND